MSTSVSEIDHPERLMWMHAMASQTRCKSDSTVTRRLKRDNSQVPPPLTLMQMASNLIIISGLVFFLNDTWRDWHQCLPGLDQEKKPFFIPEPRHLAAPPPIIPLFSRGVIVGDQTSFIFPCAPVTVVSSAFCERSGDSSVNSRLTERT